MCPLGLAAGDHIVVGRVHVLRHHKWSDLDLLVEDSLAGYCSMLKGHPRPQGGGVVRQGVGEGDQGNDDGKEDEAGRKIQQGRRHTSEVLGWWCGRCDVQWGGQ